ncbi:hypothetical protein D5086_003953 [Populus alba]|uniref:Uncharacterized protein n=1 Tax=Populus alba TaxID=43335 RepID=A0ACC4D794_POPAL
MANSALLCKGVFDVPRILSQVIVSSLRLSAVKAGEAIPIDGENCEADEKTLTGESFPVANKTTALAEDCVVAKMEKLVEEARNSKSKTQRFIDKFAQYYTPEGCLHRTGFSWNLEVKEWTNQKLLDHSIFSFEVVFLEKER